MDPEELVERAVAAGVDRIAITDHGRVEAALAAHARHPDRVIVGEEIRCRERTELIGLFLTERIPQRLPIREVAERIRAQGGVVYAPHPFAYARHPRRHAERSFAVADVIEAFNSRAFLPRWNRVALAAARERGIPVAAGSDSHFPWELGRAFAEMPAFADARQFLAAVRSARAVGRMVGGPWLHVASAALKGGRFGKPGWCPGAHGAGEVRPGRRRRVVA